MSTYLETFTETFHLVSCYSCGSRFGVASELHRCRVRDANSAGLFCPACGKVTVWQKSEDKKRIEQLERELVTEKNRAETQKRAAEFAREQREATERQLASTKGVVTRIKNRVGKGVCPCCNRTFQNLHDHMKTQHPDFTKADDK